MAVDEAGRGTYRQYRGIVAILVAVIAIIFPLYHVVYITGILGNIRIFIDLPWHLAAHLGLILLLTFLLVPVKAKAARQKLPWYDVVLALVGLGWNLYIMVNFNAVYARSVAGYLQTYEYIGSWLNMLVVLEATRRLMGWAIPTVAAFFLLYALTANHFPGFLRASGYDWTRVGRYVGLFVTGMYGNVLYISATIVVSFIIFGQFLFMTGAGEWFMNIAQALLGHVRGGPAKMSVAASALVGTITGSSMADVATVGVFTIPLMKRVGYRAHIAAAVEAASANGAQIMPPVMGIAAFIMVDFLGVPYSRIVLAAFLPALAYYLALFLMVDFEAAKTGLRGVPRTELPNAKKLMRQGWQFLLALATLLVLLIGYQYSPETSALYATGVLIATSFFNKKSRLTPDKFLLGLKNTAIVMLMMATVCAIAGIIIGCVQLTGLSYRLSTGLIGLSGGNVWVLLVLTALTALILGTGMTTSAVYLILAVLVAPALVQMGFTPLAAHFFIFYYGVAALITPPVCPASYVAAGIAGASPMRTGLSATRLAVVTFIAPFIFIFHPALLMEGVALAVLAVAVATFVATVALAAGLAGYLFGNLNIWWRILFLASSLLIIFPETITTIVGGSVIVAALALKFFLSQRSSRKAAMAGVNNPK